MHSSVCYLDPYLHLLSETGWKHSSGFLHGPDNNERWGAAQRGIYPSPALPRLQKEGRGEFTACESENLTPLHTEPSCPADLTPTAPEAAQSSGRDAACTFSPSEASKSPIIPPHRVPSTLGATERKHGCGERGMFILWFLKCYPGSFIAFHHSVLLLMTLMTHKKLGNKRSATFFNASSQPKKRGKKEMGREVGLCLHTVFGH